MTAVFLGLVVGNMVGNFLVSVSNVPEIGRKSLFLQEIKRREAGWGGRDRTCE